MKGKKWRGPVFQHIGIIKLEDLDSGWKISMSRLSEAAAETLEPNPDFKKIAKFAYGAVGESFVLRAENLGKVTTSINKYGFQSVCDVSEDDLQSRFPYNPDACLPRIVRGNKCDDGRHRLAAMWACGYKEAVVSFCVEKNFPSERRPEMLKVLSEDTKKAAIEFGKTKEYANWKERESKRHVIK